MAAASAGKWLFVGRKQLEDRAFEGGSLSRRQALKQWAENRTDMPNYGAILKMTSCACKKITQINFGCLSHGALAKREQGG
jgi:hypothetical protein